MARIAGSKNKPKAAKKVITKRILVRSPEIEEQEYLMESSVPLGELEDRTEDYQPRSRSAMTREASLRAKQEKIDKFKRSINTQQLGHTFLPDHLLHDPEYVYQWCREKVKDRDDSKNLRFLENVGGWEYVEADIAPEIAFYSPDGTVQDSASRIRDNGLILMRRFHEIHVYDLEKREKERKQQNRIQNIIRTVNTELHPFATGGVDHGNSFFPSDPSAAQFSGVFGQ